MQTNKKVEIVAEKLRQLVPDFTMSESYVNAAQIIDAVESVNTEEICEQHD
jgi:hypothetical protein